MWGRWKILLIYNCSNANTNSYYSNSNITTTTIQKEHLETKNNRINQCRPLLGMPTTEWTSSHRILNISCRNQLMISSSITSYTVTKSSWARGFSQLVGSWGCDDPPYYPNPCVCLFACVFVRLFVCLLCFYVVILNVFVFLIYSM